MYSSGGCQRSSETHRADNRTHRADNRTHRADIQYLIMALDLTYTDTHMISGFAKLINSPSI